VLGIKGLGNLVFDSKEGDPTYPVRIGLLGPFGNLEELGML